MSSNPEEASFDEGATLAVVDDSDPNWWKIEKTDKILLAPATYMELAG